MRIKCCFVCQGQGFRKTLFLCLGQEWEWEMCMGVGGVVVGDAPMIRFNVYQ